ncbi:MAG TPA: pyridoxamine 5'-phosphate oxidase family protein [Streptosporangiaceae bacterium]|jgi:hypothetical protein
MNLTADLPPADRERAESRLHSNAIAWLTTVRPDGQPVTVPVWFLLRDAPQPRQMTCPPPARTPPT